MDDGPVFPTSVAGIAIRLLAPCDDSGLASPARERCIRSGFVLTDDHNRPASSLYASAGGQAGGVDTVWQFTYTDG